MNNLLFLIFYLALYISGAGIYGIFTKFLINKLNDERSFLNTDKIFHCLYPLISLFILGNVALILNFFLPIKISIFIIYTALLSFSLFGFFILFKNKFKDFKITSQIIFPIILSFGSYGVTFHYDSGAYHLGYQSWIFNEKIVFGLSNINPYFSYGSINEYLYSIFSFFDTNIFYSFIDLIFFVVFFGFMFDLIKQSQNLFLKNSALIILMYSLLDNFGYNGGGNGSLQIQMVGKPDTAVGVLWVIVSIFVIYDITEKKPNNYNFFLILLFSLFAFQLKVNAGPLIFMIIFYAFRFRKQISFFKLHNTLLYLTFLIYIIKNIFVSGCLLYPLISSCINNLSWLNIDHLIESTMQLMPLNKAISFNKDFFYTFNEFINHQYNKQIYINLLGSLILVFLIKKVIFIKDRENFSVKIYFSIFLVMNYLLFFSTVPAFRNGFGLFTSTFLLFSLSNLKIKPPFKFLFNKIVIFVLIFSTLLLFPRFFMYTSAIESKFQFVDFDKKFQNYIVEDNYVVPTESNQCWDVRNCLLKTSHNNIFITYEKFSYKFIESFK